MPRSLVAMAMLIALAPALVRAETAAPARPMAAGLNLDLLPTIATAAAGTFGYAPQVWVGAGHVRLRFVGAHLVLPDALSFVGTGFHRATTTAFASIVDYVFGDRFAGFWVGTGFEVWQRTIEHDGVPGKTSWSSTVFTVGAGHIWRVFDRITIDPWIGAHVTLNPETVNVGAYACDPSVVNVEASLKVGVLADL